MTTPTTKISAMMVTLEQDTNCRGYAHLIATVCFIDTEDRTSPGHGCHQGAITWYHYGESKWTDGFRISSQANNDDSPRHFYAISPEYRTGCSIDLADAEIMAKTLKKVNNGLQKVADKEGHARTAAEVIFRTAKVLGVKAFVFRHTDAQMDASDYRYTSENVDGRAFNHIRRIEEDYIREGARETAAA